MADTAPGLIIPHEPTDACHDSHCYWHHVDEPADGAYRVCFECRHVYPTAEDLRAAFASEISPDLDDPAAEPPPAEQIYACPLCAHDW
jgi:hypothetical protein